MPGYEIYGRVLHSELMLPELPQAGTVRCRFPALRFEQRRSVPPAGGWFTIWHRPDGLPWVRAAPTLVGYHVQYCNCAEFSLDFGRGVIAGEAIDCADDMFRHFLVDQIVPLMLSVEDVVLHASAVSVDGRLAAFVGPGGSGKSTTALALSHLGHAIAADDGLLMLMPQAGEIVGVPAYAGVRVWPDSETALAEGLHGSGRQYTHGKQRFRDGLPFVGAGSLTHLYLLVPGGAPSVSFEPLSPRDAAVAMIRQSFRLALDDRAVLARQLDRIAYAAPALSAWQVVFPRALDDALAFASRLVEHVRGSSPPDVGVE
jgi:hypothetical protein